MALERRAERRRRSRKGVVDEDDRMGIAHVDGNEPHLVAKRLHRALGFDRHLPHAHGGALDKPVVTRFEPELFMPERVRTRTSRRSTNPLS